MVVEGGNDPAACTAALNTVNTCMKDVAAGRRFKGKYPYVKFNPRSKRLLFLDFVEEVGCAIQRTQKILKRGRVGEVEEHDKDIPRGRQGQRANSKQPRSGSGTPRGKTDTPPKGEDPDDPAKAKKRAMSKALANVEKVKKEAMMAS